MLIDTHAHLSDAKFDPDRDAAVQRAWDAGLAGIVEIADNEAEWPRARSLAESHSGRVFWTAGLHPYYADRADAGLLERLRGVLSHPRLVAVGEVGLDYYRHCAVPRDVQKKALADLLAAARAADKPVVIHCREADPASDAAQRDMWDIFRRILPPAASGGPVAGVLHCFQGGAEFARNCLGLGFMIGVDAPVTYPKAEALRRTLADIPLDRLVLETDSPYLPPQERRGQRNEPSYIISVAEELARLKGVSRSELEERTSANAERLYRCRFGNG